jgi:hypothetical protein
MKNRNHTKVDDCILITSPIFIRVIRDISGSKFFTRTTPAKHSVFAL